MLATRCIFINPPATGKWLFLNELFSGIKLGPLTTPKMTATERGVPPLILVVLVYMIYACALKCAACCFRRRSKTPPI